MVKPKKLYWVEMKLSESLPRSKRSSGIRGGKRSSLQACLDSRRMILAADPQATVKIYEADVLWREVE